MKNRQILSIISLAVIMTALTVMGCKKKYDDPATIVNPGVTENTTILQLKTLYSTNSGDLKLITDDIIIKGIVVGNDRTGNIYKMIYIQDATAGIQIDIEGTGLYNIFPVGREVYVKCKGLYIANSANMVKLATRVVENGTPTTSGIPSTYIDTYLKRGSINNTVTPAVVTVAQLKANPNLQSMLVQLANYEVAPGDFSKTYADTSVNKSNTNITLQTCTGGTNNNIIMRSSGYANFAGVKVPQGNGTVTAIYTVFNSTPQLIIRDTTDVQFKGPRCGSNVPAGLNYLTIAQIRALYINGPATIPANTGIRGAIVSNKNNEATFNYRIQDGSGAGIQLRFPTFNPNYDLYDSVRVEVSGLTVDMFNGDMQINNIINTDKVGTGTPAVRTTTIAQIVANQNAWASTQVRLTNVTITAGTTNSTGKNYTITENATGATIQTFIRNTLGYTPPATATSITGYVSIFNGTPQLTLRSAADVQ
jgi:hypothetical protein